MASLWKIKSIFLLFEICWKADSISYRFATTKSTNSSIFASNLTSCQIIEKCLNVGRVRLPFTVIKCGFPSDNSFDSWVCTNATWAVICCELELLGDDATELAGNIAETVIGASSGESDWSIGTTSIIETPSDVVPVWSINFF